MIAAVQAAGTKDRSVLQIQPLRSAGVDALVARARAEVALGDYGAAADLYDRALRNEPGAPDLLQARAEMAMAMGQWERAQAMARQAISTGPRFGALCARSWQVLAEIAQARGEAARYSTDRQHVDACDKPDPAGE